MSKMTVRKLRSTKQNVTWKLTPGWRGKGKGMLQILLEQGWICDNELGQYRIKLVGNEGFLVKEYSLAHTC